MAKHRYKYTARLVREFSIEVEAADEYEAVGWGETLIDGASGDAPCTKPDGKEVPWWWEFVSLEKLDNNPPVPIKKEGKTENA